MGFFEWAVLFLLASIAISASAFSKHEAKLFLIFPVLPLWLASGAITYNHVLEWVFSPIVHFFSK